MTELPFELAQTHVRDDRAEHCRPARASVSGVVRSVFDSVIEGTWVTYRIDAHQDITIHPNEVEALRYAVDQEGRRALKVAYGVNVAERVERHAKTITDRRAAEEANRRQLARPIPAAGPL